MRPLCVLALLLRPAAAMVASASAVARDPRFPARRRASAAGTGLHALADAARPGVLGLYAMFVMMAVGGLMATAQLGPIAKDFHVDKVPVSLSA